MSETLWKKKKNPTNVYPSSGCRVGLLGRDTCHNHQTFLIPSGPREAAKVKLFKGKEGREEEKKKWLTMAGGSQRIRSVKFKL